MLARTFQHLPGIGPRAEAKLWEQGITHWDRFVRARKVPGIGTARKAYLDRHLRADQQALAYEEWERFTTWPLTLHHRALPHLERIMYLDIETYGVRESRVTLIALSDGEHLEIIDGTRADRDLLEQRLTPAQAIVTFNGNRFDLPYLARAYAYRPCCFRIDLEPLCTRIGLSGGLKRIEREIGIERDQQLAAGDPLALWRSYRATEDAHFLELLTAYIEQDVRSLPVLLEKVLRTGEPLSGSLP